ncbi:DUF6141 family protein [Lentibacillus sp. CBA3610]|uniref:DUF6141 family protein n=1 Tax=Lentibacillus sp. CBA3610 TaxID=2518176 RepID=UPI0015958422|nr:DUF6141 family protein [Lentibacillus sp. CBA3610]QKY69399.1 hypothetical protein Len3610_07145 [Lentibacillus sp. CBA3610]
MRKTNKVVYCEIQRFHQVWLWILVLLLAGLMWYITIKQIIFGIPMGDNPAPDLLLVIFWLAFGIIFPVFMLWICRLIIEVRSDGVYMRFAPFHKGYKSFLFKDIISYKPVVYNSLKRFGGWGVRFNAKGETAYNISGKQGVELQFRNNNVVVGTQNSNELIKAMDSVQKYNEN